MRKSEDVSYVKNCRQANASVQNGCTKSDNDTEVVRMFSIMVIMDSGCD